MRIRTAARSAARPALLAALALALLACAPEDDDDLPELEEATQALASGTVTTLIQGIGDAENATFSPEGRLFVTGGENAYEIKRVGSGYGATKLYAGTCNFTGIIVRSGTLYTTCIDSSDLTRIRSYLLAAPLSTPAATPIALKIVHTFTQVMLANGIAFDERGRLFVADFTPLAGRLVTLSFSPSSPLQVTRETVWHDVDHPLANGVKIFEGKVYLSDLGQIKVIPILSDGTAGRVSVLASRLAVFDDLYVSKAGIIVGDFYGGKLVTYSLGGRLLRETPMLFRSPSSVTPTRGPLFAEGALLVTEKGALGELTSTDGNRLSLYQP